MDSPHDVLFRVLVAGADMSDSLNNTFTNRVLVAVLALLAAVFYLLYRRKRRLDRLA